MERRHDISSVSDVLRHVAAFCLTIRELNPAEGVRLMNQDKHTLPFTGIGRLAKYQTQTASGCLLVAGRQARWSSASIATLIPLKRFTMQVSIRDVVIFSGRGQYPPRRYRFYLKPFSKQYSI